MRSLSSCCSCLLNCVDRIPCDIDYAICPVSLNSRAAFSLTIASFHLWRVIAGAPYKPRQRDVQECKYTPAGASWTRQEEQGNPRAIPSRSTTESIWKVGHRAILSRTWTLADITSQRDICHRLLRTAAILPYREQ